MSISSLFGKKKVEQAVQQPTTTTPQETPEAVQATSQELQQVKQVADSAQQISNEAEQTAVQVKTLEIAAEANEAAHSVRPVIRPHAFVVMPFGKKKGGDGSIYDFNSIYTQLIKPMLESAGFEPFRADEESASGDILTDMFQELLLADLVLADMSIDNANVFYELGIRHAFRKRGVVHIQAGRAYMPFDVFNVRTIPYHITPEGVPDPEFLEKDKAAIARVCRATWASEPERVHSPIFNLLTGLVEPDRRALHTPLATGFWREYNEWNERITLAQQQKRIGDILLLTEEIRNPLIKEDAIGEAGKALANLGRHELALSQYRKGLEVNPRNLTFRRQEAFHLNRLGRADEAIIKIEKLLADVPTDTEAIAFLGRIYKEMWYESWKWIQEKELRLQTAFESYHWLLKSFETYLKGYRVDLKEVYPGINALTLGTILVHLADKYDDKNEPDPEIQAVYGLLPELRGALIFALETKAEEENPDYWALISLAELRVLTADAPRQVTRAYRKALTASRRNESYLQSSLGQLEILHSLDIRAEFVQIGIKAIKEEIRRIRKEIVTEETEANKSKVHKEIKPGKKEGQVFLFTGYMVNYPSKEGQHFPADKENAVRHAISKILDKYGACAEDMAFTAGLASGSELIFAELCTERGIRIESHLPVAEAGYVRDFISPCGDNWVERFYKVRNHPLAFELYQEDCVGIPKDDDDPYERNNRWALYSSLIHGIDKVRLIALWDGKGGRPKDRDARLVNHMVDLMRDTGGIVEHIHASKLMHMPPAAEPDQPSELTGTLTGKRRKSVKKK